MLVLWVERRVDLYADTNVSEEHTASIFRVEDGALQMEAICSSETPVPTYITTINWLTLFKEIIAVYSENHMKHINALCGQNDNFLNVKICGTYSYRYSIKG
jgi:hypothetical protein